jgi:Gpi18-like mannosyltransferase
MPERALPRTSSSPWSPTLIAALLGGLASGTVARILLWPTTGLTGDLDQFVLWVHGIAVGPFSHAYDQNLSFPPVMAYTWGLLAVLEPAFRTVTTSADPAIRAVMKAPASIADLALGLLVAWHLRGTPRWAVAGALAIVLHPAVIDVSAWWGQYESIYLLGGAVAFVLAVRGHSLWAAAALGVALMTKPQALPFLVPFAAWFLARDGWRGAIRAGIVGAATIVVLWLPFIAAGGVGGYARNLAEYQGDIFSFLSLRAWNLWWLVQEWLAPGQFVGDQNAALGGLTFRMLGYALTLAAELAVFVAVLRQPTPRTLAFGLAAAVLVAFAFLTTMHERYAFGALVFLVLAFPDRVAAGLAVAFGIVFTLNLFAAIPPSPDIDALLDVGGPLGLIGSVAMLAILAGVAIQLRARGRDADEPVAAATPTPAGAGA